jgi:Xaa-Pro aminopeptidase
MGFDALIVTDIFNIRYLTGFTGSSACVVITPDNAYFLTDSSYETQAISELPGNFKLRIYGGNWIDGVVELFKRLKPALAGFESNRLSYDSLAKLRKAVKGRRFTPSLDVVRELRKVKDKAEIDYIRRSIVALESGFKEVKRRLRPGVIEKDVAFYAELAMRKNGAERLAFDSIVASGPRAALPHGKASDKAVKKGEFVVVDMGARLDGYNSDETRTYLTGKPVALHKKIYATVLEAQLMAIDSIRPGAKAVDVDNAARGVIKKAGYGKYFGHALGHGVGLEVHEGPALSPVSKDVLCEGMVVTVEPGIYVPDWGGVRIEDMALVTRTGCEIITKTNKELCLL